jgi:hypothetical protein
MTQVTESMQEQSTTYRDAFPLRRQEQSQHKVSIYDQGGEKCGDDFSVPELGN